MVQKIVRTVEQALAGLTDGMSIAVGGFGVVGNPFTLINGVVELGTTDLKIYSNNPGSQVGDELIGLAALFARRQVSKFAGSYIGANALFEQQFLRGEVAAELIPQGTLAEKLRAGGAGIPAFYTATGVGSVVSEGGLPVRHDADARVIEASAPKETRSFEQDGQLREYVLEESIRTDFALVRAWKADADGNLVFHSTAQNFNPDCAMAGKITVVEVEHIVPTGQLRPEEIHLPGIYVDRLLPLRVDQIENKPIEQLLTRTEDNGDSTAHAETTDQSRPGWTREGMARRAALELRDGQYVNMGIGLPTMVPSYVPEGVRVTLQSENGILKTGRYPLDHEVDPDTINAGKQTTTIQPGGSVFNSSMSFAMIRGGHVDTAVLGALEVAESGDIANWGIPGKKMKGMGGAMDLVEGAQRVIALMEHQAPDGSSRVRRACTLPLTARGAVDRLITNLAVFDVTANGFELVELAPGVSLEQLRECTDAEFRVAELSLSH